MNFHLHLLGSFAATVDKQPIHFRLDKIQALLAYLAVEGGGAQRRERLATLLWENHNDRQARVNLRSTFSRLGKALDKQSKSTISKSLFASNRQTIQLIVDDPKLTVWCDETLFQRLISTCEAHQHQNIHYCSVCLARLEQTADLYRGEFLQGLTIDDAETFSEWLLLKREQLYQQALNVLDILVSSYLTQGDVYKVRFYGQRLLELEPWHEKTHRQIMLALARDGKRSAALTQYGLCRQVLLDELGVEPGEETAVLYQKIRDRQPLGDMASDAVGQTTPRARQTAATERPKNNLPSSLTPYFGREKIRNDLTQLLLTPDNRFITLLGEGGVGKTRLSLEVGRRVLNGFADGVWFVPLAGLTASVNGLANGTSTNGALANGTLANGSRAADSLADDMAGAIAQALNHSLSGKESPQTQLIRFLQERQLLLILDNFEHLLAGANLVTELLQQTTAVSILCSSRVPLDIRGEYLFPLQQLPLPSLPDAHAPQPQGGVNFSHYACVQLFADRALRTGGWFELEAEAQLPVAELCHLVAGIPLGIELAAASLQQRTLEETIAAIRQSLDTMTTRLRDIPQRHRSMRAVFETSWALLTETERRLLAQLSVFRGGFVATAVSAITDANQATLESLHKKSLLTLRNGRYALHELLRQYASEKLLAREAVASRHSHYFLQFLAEREQALAGEMPQVPAAEITAELDNIRHGWRFASNNQQATSLLAGLNAFADYLMLRGRYREAEHLFGQAAQQLQAISDDTAIRTHARLLIHQTSAFVRLSQYDQAITHAQRALHHAEIAQDPWSQGYAHLHWSEALWRQGSYEQAIKYLEISRHFAISNNLDRLLGACCYHLNIIQDFQGDYEQAKINITRALEIWKRLGNRQQETYSSNSLGVILYHLNSYDEAQLAFDKALVLSRKIGDFQAQSSALNNLSLISTANKKFAQARNYLEQSLNIALSIGNKSFESLAYSNLGRNSFIAKHYDEARNFLEKSLKINKQIKDPLGEAMILKTLGDLAVSEMNYDLALECYRDALQICEEIGNDYTKSEVQKAMQAIEAKVL